MSIESTHGYYNFEQMEHAIKNRQKFNTRYKSYTGLKRGHYSIIDDDEYRVYTRVDDGNILMLRVKGNKVIHIDRTFYTASILKLQQIIRKYY